MKLYTQQKMDLPKPDRKTYFEINELHSVYESVKRVSETMGVPFGEALALFEDYAIKMAQCYNLLGGYPDFSTLLERGTDKC